MSEHEKGLFRQKQGALASADSEKKALGDDARNNKSGSICEVLSRVYVWSFCLYMFCNNYLFYTNFATSPFYLDNILNAR